MRRIDRRRPPPRPWRCRNVDRACNDDRQLPSADEVPRPEMPAPPIQWNGDGQTGMRWRRPDRHPARHRSRCSLPRRRVWSGTQRAPSSANDLTASTKTATVTSILRQREPIQTKAHATKRADEQHRNRTWICNGRSIVGFPARVLRGSGPSHTHCLIARRQGPHPDPG